MRDLLLFNLRRRFLNKTTIVLYVIILILLGLLAFSDYLIHFLVPDFYASNKIDLVNIDGDLFLRDVREEFELSSDADLRIALEDGVFLVSSKQTLSVGERAYIEVLLQNYENIKNPVARKAVIFEAKEDFVVNDDGFYIVITSLYFMVLSFASLGSSEVVMEKTTHILQSIAVIVGIRKHYFSKIILGWGMVLLQSTYILSLASLLLILRYFYDRGAGLLDLAYRLSLTSERFNNFTDFLESLNLNGALLYRYGLALVFLFMGVGLMQVIMISISSRVNSIEEAGSLQGPLYVFFLVIYYLAILLNTPEHMNGGWGTYLSFVPFASMLLMPIRLLKYSVSATELLLAFSASLLLLIFLYTWGYRFYKRSIFEYVPKKKALLTRTHS